MLESSLTLAFVAGLISACSLPLGTLTSAVWHPGARSTAVLMAFGGGALLAALTIDLVASALEMGHFYPLAIGCILGGLLFDLLNQIVNHHGGFLRKASTTIYHLRRERRRRFRRILSHIGRMDVFQGLPAEEAEELANAASHRELAAHTFLYRCGEPSDNLYIIDSGEVELLDPENGMRPFQRLSRNDAFARMAFFTNAPHATAAMTGTDSRVWIVPRHAFDRLLAQSRTLTDSTASLIGGEEVATYLRKRHGMTNAQVTAWVEEAVAVLHDRHPVPAAAPLERKEEEFQSAFGQLDRFPVLRDLPEGETKALAHRVFCKTYGRGESLFQRGEPADRLYVVNRGEVALLNPGDGARRPLIVRERQVFGGMAFLTGSRHAVSAIATTKLSVWVLRKADFDELLQRYRRLDERVSEFLRQEQVPSYLERQQNFDPIAAADWTRKALRSLETGRLIPAVHDMTDEVKAHHGAPLAIWLGILLDGIPESLVLGASTIHSQLSLSLVAGLFLSNYPESLSSSVGMRQQGMRFRRILLMWTALMVLTGLGAALGNVFFVGASPVLFSLVQGVAAGAMLTMIAETMLPEAYFKGGSVTGFSTLMGFLAAIFFKTLE